jgi:hypothetical protein
MNRVLSIGLMSTAIAGLSAFGVSAAPVSPHSAPAEAASQAVQIQHRHHYRRHHHRHGYYHRRYYDGPRVYYGPRYYGAYYRDYDYYPPYAYGGVGLPFISLGFGHRHHHRHW